MDWKSIIKNIFGLWAVMLLFGFIFLKIFDFNPTLILNDFWFNFQFWPTAVIISVAVPLGYAFIMKSKSIKELALLAILLILLASTVHVIALTIFIESLKAPTDEMRDVGTAVQGTLQSSPGPTLSSAICSSLINYRDINARCNFTGNGIVDNVLANGFASGIVFMSLLAGQSLRRKINSLREH